MFWKNQVILVLIMQILAMKKMRDISELIKFKIAIPMTKECIFLLCSVSNKECLRYEQINVAREKMCCLKPSVISILYIEHANWFIFTPQNILPISPRHWNVKHSRALINDWLSQWYHVFIMLHLKTVPCHAALVSSGGCVLLGLLKSYPLLDQIL